MYPVVYVLSLSSYNFYIYNLKLLYCLNYTALTVLLNFSFNCGSCGPGASSPMRGRPVIARLKSSPQKRYPTHNPLYSGIGILPTVRLNRPPRSILSEHNSSMLGRSPRLKLPPPDVLKPPVPAYAPTTRLVEETRDKI